MPKKKLTFTDFCESLGCRLNNPAWAWCGVGYDNNRVVVTVWNEHLISDRIMLWNSARKDIDRKLGGRELHKVLTESLGTNRQILGIVCHAKTPNIDSYRTRSGYEDKLLLVLELEKENDNIIGILKGKIPTAAAQSNFSLPPTSPIRETVNDLEEPPLGVINPDRALTRSSRYIRDEGVRSFVVKRSKGQCEYCGQAGFKRLDKGNYVEAHHIIALSCDGPDTPGNVIALCANHHREAHYGARAEELEIEFMHVLEKLKNPINLPLPANP